MIALKCSERIAQLPSGVSVTPADEIDHIERINLREQRTASVLLGPL